MFRKNVPSGTLAPRTEGEALTRWSPWEELADIRHRMEELFSRAFGYTPLSRLIPGEPGVFEPDVDLYETNEKVILMAATPGFKPEEIKVEATPDTIQIEGERKALFEDEKAVQHRGGWLSGSSRFSLSYTLPTEIDPNKVKATFSNGVLQLEMPKTERARAKGVKVNVTAAP